MFFNTLKRMFTPQWRLFSTTTLRLEDNPEKYYKLGKRKPFTEMYNGKMYNFSVSKYVFLPPVMKKSVGPRGEMYRPNIEKRMNCHGLTTRLKTRGGKQILWRKILNGRFVDLQIAP